MPIVGDRLHAIRERAYSIWEQAGQRNGNEWAHWFQAEAEIESTQVLLRDLRESTMTSLVDRASAPDHLFIIPELDFSRDLFVEPLIGPWFRLAAWTTDRRRDDRGVEDVVSRQSFLLSPGSFSDAFDDLQSIGNVIGHLGIPVSSITPAGQEKSYYYAPFYRFELNSSGIAVEPLVFIRTHYCPVDRERTAVKHLI